MDRKLFLLKKFIQKLEELCRDPISEHEKDDRDVELLKDGRVRPEGHYK